VTNTQAKLAVSPKSCPTSLHKPASTSKPVVKRVSPIIESSLEHLSSTKSTTTLSRPEENLRNLVSRLEDEKVLLEAEKQLHWMTLVNSAVIYQTLTQFFTKLIKEVHYEGFDFSKLRIVHEVLSESHMNIL